MQKLLRNGRVGGVLSQRSVSPGVGTEEVWSAATVAQNTTASLKSGERCGEREGRRGIQQRKESGTRTWRQRRRALNEARFPRRPASPSFPLFSVGVLNCGMPHAVSWLCTAERRLK